MRDVFQYNTLIEYFYKHWTLAVNSIKLFCDEIAFECKTICWIIQEKSISLKKYFSFVLFICSISIKQCCAWVPKKAIHSLFVITKWKTRLIIYHNRLYYWWSVKGDPAELCQMSHKFVGFTREQNNMMICLCIIIREKPKTCLSVCVWAACELLGSYAQATNMLRKYVV